MQTSVELVRRHPSPDGHTCQLFFRCEEPMSFVEGQFVMLEPNIIYSHPLQPAKRAYSIGSSMQLMDSEQVFTTIVKRTGPDGMSDYLTQYLKVGDKMVVSGPYGHMVDTQKHHNYLLISVGSGITPLYSIYQKLIQTSDYERIARLYGEKFTKNLLPNLVTEWTFNESPSCRHRCHLSREQGELPAGWHSGRVGESLEEALAYLGDDAGVYLCGHPAMVDEMRHILIEEKWFAKEDVKFEKY